MFSKHSFLCLFLSSLFLSSCGGGGSTQEERVGSGGTPVQLAISAPARQRLTVTTTSNKSVKVGDQTRESTVTTGINVDARMTQRGDQFQLDVLREIKSYSPEASRPTDLQLTRLSTMFNANGTALEFDNDVTIYDVLALDGFHIVALTLSHPGTPVSVGDTWTERSALPSMNTAVVTRVEGLDDQSITVSKRIDPISDANGRYSVSAEMSAVYALNSLLLRSADITLTLRYEDSLYINGEKHSIVDGSTFTQTIRETIQ
jgi:hypothetical protein